MKFTIFLCISALLIFGGKALPTDFNSDKAEDEESDYFDDVLDFFDDQDEADYESFLTSLANFFLSPDSEKNTSTTVKPDVTTPSVVPTDAPKLPTNEPPKNTEVTSTQPESHTNEPEKKPVDQPLAPEETSDLKPTESTGNNENRN